MKKGRTVVRTGQLTFNKYQNGLRSAKPLARTVWIQPIRTLSDPGGTINFKRVLLRALVLLCPEVMTCHRDTTTHKKQTSRAFDLKLVFKKNYYFYSHF